MTFDPIAAQLAVRSVSAAARSARPDAPVVPHREPRRPYGATLRNRLADGLRAAAVRVEPHRSHVTGASQPG